MVKKYIACSLILVTQQLFAMDFFQSVGEAHQTIRAVKEAAEQMKHTILPGVEAAIHNATQLHGAIIKGQLAELDQLPNLPRCINAPDSNKRAPIHYAALSCNVEQINWLLDHGAEVTPQDWQQQTPLHCAAHNCANIKTALTACKLLAEKMDAESLNARDAHGFTAFHYAVLNEHIELMDYLIRRGANIVLGDKQGNTAFHLAIRKGKSRAKSKLLPYINAFKDTTNTRGETPLHFAASAGDKDLAQTLIIKGADIEAARADDQWTPLFCAVAANRIETVQALQGMWANLNAQDSKKRTPICIAATSTDLTLFRHLLNAHVQITDDPVTATVLCALKAKQFVALQELFRREVDKNKRYAKGKTALHVAVEEQDNEAVAFLLQEGINPNIKDDAGTTPLISAVTIGDEQIVRSLLGRKADPIIKDDNGFDAFYHATKQGRPAILTLLLTHAHQKSFKMSSWNIYGASLLHVAALFGHTHLVELLIQQGIPGNQIDSNGETALHYAITGIKDSTSPDKHKSMVQTLIYHNINTAVKNHDDRTARDLAVQMGLAIMIDGLEL